MQRYITGARFTARLGFVCLLASLVPLSGYGQDLAAEAPLLIKKYSSGELLPNGASKTRLARFFGPGLRRTLRLRGFDPPRRTHVPNDVGFAFRSSITGAGYEGFLVCGLNESQYLRVSSLYGISEYSQGEDHNPTSDRRTTRSWTRRGRRLSGEQPGGGVQSG